MFTKYLLEVNKGEDTLLINSLTGAIDLINADDLKKIKDGKKNKTYYLLKKRGYMEEDERKIRENLIESCSNHISNFTNRLNLLLCLTYSCNLRCTYCFQHHSIHTENDVMKIEQVEKALLDVETQILNKFKKDEYVISLFGGEPLQKKTYQIVEKILSIARRKRIFVNIITNGVELDYFVELLKEFKQNISIQVTLDGVKDIHNKNRPGYKFINSYDPIAKNISQALQYEIPLIVRVNTTIDSSKNLDEFIDSKDVRKWMTHNNFKLEIAPVTNHFNEHCNSKIYQESLVLDAILKKSNVINKIGNKVSFTADMFRMTGYLRTQFDTRINYRINPTIRYCEATYLSTFAVGPDGYVYLCTDAIGRKELSAGTYYPELKLNDQYIKQLKNRNVFRMQECKECNIASFCGGGCPTAALKEYKDAGRNFCGNAKEVVNDFLTTLL